MGGQTHWQVSSQVHASRKKPILKQTYPVFHWLIIGSRTSLNLRRLGLDGLTVKTSFDLRANLISAKVSASHRKSTQVHARPGQTVSQVNPSCQVAAPFGQGLMFSW